MTDAIVRPPSGFHLLMPPGWQQFMVNETGKRALVAVVSAKIKQLGRPDLDVQARTLVEQQWRRLKQLSATAFYLPGESQTDVPIPMTISTRQLVAPQGSTFADAVRAFARTDPTHLELPGGDGYRWRSTGVGSGETSEARTTTIGYGFAVPDLPEDIAPRGILFFCGIVSLEDSPEELGTALETLADTIMGTFRWRE